MALTRGCSTKREEDRQKLPEGFHFPTLIHPSSKQIDPHKNHIGNGFKICADAILTTNVTLGKFNLINLACSIGHDAELGDFCSLMPGVRISGGVKIGRGVYLGTNAVVLPNIKIGDYATVGAGTVVTKDVPSYSTVVGVPGEIIKHGKRMSA